MLVSNDNNTLLKGPFVASTTAVTKEWHECLKGSGLEGKEV